MTGAQGQSPKKDYRVITERLAGTQGYLMSFTFPRGANFYVLSYPLKGVTRHIFIDTGDSRYRGNILTILADNGIEPTNIKKIIITHRHSDHCGLADILASHSTAEILVHANFRHFVEGELTEVERRWLGDFNPAELKKHNLRYLSADERANSLTIGGLIFPILGDPISIGKSGSLVILACPKGIPTHSPDQIIVLYTTGNNVNTISRKGDYLPTDNVLFSGDLWLMHGPHFHLELFNLKRLLRLNLQIMRNLISGRGVMLRNARDQDADAKEALKQGFSLIRVKPGHGDEFLGSRIIPSGILAKRDLLLKLSYPPNSTKSVLRNNKLAPKIRAIEKEAYARFTEELGQWKESGYPWEGIAGLLVRIYKEQSGGGPLVRKDRKERRRKLATILTKLKQDKAKSSEVRDLAETTLTRLKLV
jgi:glyoxylase-like metal-dependent hydrolase (beta-lactamase superfamily II)